MEELKEDSRKLEGSFDRETSRETCKREKLNEIIFFKINVN